MRAATPFGSESATPFLPARATRPGIPVRVVALLASAALMTGGCAAPTARREVRVPVTVAAAVQQAVPDVIEATGTV